MTTTSRLPLRWPEGGLRPQVAVLCVGLVATCAGLVWLGQADALTATGHRIADLQARRSDLLEQRSEALIALAAATDPRTRASRATALGYAPPDQLTYLAVDGFAPSAPDSFATAPGAPLAIVFPRAPEAALASGPLTRWLGAIASPSAAGERR